VVATRGSGADQSLRVLSDASASAFGAEGTAARGSPVYQFVERRDWIPSLGITYKLGVDGIGLLMVLLMTITTPICVLASWTSIAHRVRDFYAALLFLEAGVVGVFLAQDLLLFYVFWEVMLVPMFLLIGVWGGERRIYAAVKFFIYTMAGSLFMLVAILYLYFKTGEAGARTFELSVIFERLQWHVVEGVRTPPQVVFSETEQFWLFLAFGIAFAIKVPMFPFHTWLPDAHVEAPTAGSVVLAAVLLKMGTYGLVRYAIPLFPAGFDILAPLLVVLAVTGIVYGALMALAQDDVKKLIAYSSVSHLGFVVLGIVAWNEKALEGAVLQMVNHGLSTGALFLFVGAIYERRHTRKIADYGGVAKAAPGLAVVLMIATLSSIGLPGLNGFVGEFLILLGSFERYSLATAVAALGIVLGAVYMLVLYQRVMLGPVKSEADATTPDLVAREWVYFVPLILLMVGIGLYPYPFLRVLDGSVQSLLRHGT
jgi:NADH-quinone oxidoreductase subunit M